MISTSSSSKKAIPTYGKQDIEQCMSNFRLLILNNLDDIQKIKTNLISSGKMGHSEKEFIRAFSWKIFLGTLSTDNKASLKSWIEDTISKRKSARKLIKSLNVNKFKGDPLGGLTQEKKDSEGWDSFYNQSETIKLIKMDVERTMQKEKLFKEPYILDIENSILKLFAKNHKKISYRQGMNEILALLIYAIYPYYIKSPISKYTDEIIEKWVKDPVENYKEIYHFFHDENELETDVYYLMENLMIKFGAIKFFEDEKRETNITPYLVTRVKNMVTEKLSKVDRQVYSYFIRHNFDYSVIFQRWIKCLLKLEFPLNNVCIIWDNLFAHEAEEPSGEIIYLDNVIIAMLALIRDDIFRSQNTELYEILTKYPDVNPFSKLINLAEKAKERLASNTIEESDNNEPEKTNQNNTASEPQKPETKVEDKPQMQMNPLLFNPNLMMNPQMAANFQNNQNMMFYPYNPMMVQQMNQAMSSGKKEEGLNEIKELKDIWNKYKKVVTVEDNDKFNELIDSISKKLI